ncbi:glutathione S-transferase family protein [Bosea caraganae]|uniref:Glutathione S-transferase family protein n=1 Tax=Bosea caraganae TaxID=2763117 RepID=A0A370L8M2_9HYPH|nr:glutathione S-transferase family protein [Bosea caraganae]RDJ26748.1 glutathione S-transferase family protein [Bosea caraganae]RDJ30635.1 glutathione S-transferase family protein [Bosea caraganae]
MSLTLYYHPLSSYCQKVLVALYENGAPFTPQFVDLGDPGQRADLLKLWPVGKFPVLRDGERIVPESSIIIEHLDRYHPGKTRLIPENGDLALQTRLRDRFFDLYVHKPMQALVGDRLRPLESRDPYGVAEAKARLSASYDMIERDMAGQTWAMGEDFTLADCAAAPSLYYADRVLPFRDSHPGIAAYFERLLQRPSFARVVEEAGPYRHMFPAARD